MHFKPYPEYKDSGIEWLGEVPAHWSEGRLKNLITLYSGSDYKSHTEASDDESQYPVYGSGGIFTYTSKFLFRGESILLGRKGTLDKPLYVTGSFWTVDTMFYSKVVHRNHGKFAYYHALLMPFSLYSSNTAIPSMKGSDLSNSAVVIPPPNVQVDIACFLDKETSKIDILISKQEKLIQLLEEQRKSIISHAVTKGLNPNAPMKDSGVEWLGEVPAHWSIIKNKKILSFSKGLTITKENLQEEGIPTINYGEVHSKYGFEFSPSLNPVLCVPFQYLDEFKSCLLNRGDFIFADTSEDLIGVGNFSFLNTNEVCFAGYHTIIARLYKSHEFKFLAYEFESQIYREQLRRSVKGIKVFSITQEILKNALCWLPIIEEQKKIVEYLDQETSKIDTAIDKQKQLIGKLKEYRSSIISHAVTGKIDVRDLAA